ncbi:hypothetical protein [Novosphingobium colocasiae]|uniref:hypothetical protein n=1 Tax=Novosphingobium colocasiae TaxID=1256513 RepID=UPI0035B197A7
MTRPIPANTLNARRLPARSRLPLAAALTAALALAGCNSTVVPVASTPRPAAGGGGLAPVRPPNRTTPRDPAFQSIPGLEDVIGASQGQLTRLFGTPRLDVWEGDARKLQFTGTACLLDIYLYPTSRSREPLATWVDARRGSDGQEVDRAACVAALKQR